MPHLDHPYYDPYYYYDWYYNTPGSDAVGIVLFLIFIFAIFWMLWVCWGDTSKPTTKTKRVDYTPVVEQPRILKPVKPSAPVTVKPVKPYVPINPMVADTQIDFEVTKTGWNDRQIDLVKRINTNSFFKLAQSEIIRRLKTRKNPRRIASALINLRKRLVGKEPDVDFLERFIDMNIFNIQKTDILNIQPENRLLAVDIISRLTGYVNGYKDLPDRIMLWVTDLIV